jgi:hypothetical protein
LIGEIVLRYCAALQFLAQRTGREGRQVQIISPSALKIAVHEMSHNHPTRSLPTQRHLNSRTQRLPDLLLYAKDCSVMACVVRSTIQDLTYWFLSTSQTTLKITALGNCRTGLWSRAIHLLLRAKNCSANEITVS